MIDVVNMRWSAGARSLSARDPDIPVIVQPPLSQATATTGRALEISGALRRLPWDGPFGKGFSSPLARDPKFWIMYA